MLFTNNPMRSAISKHLANNSKAEKFLILNLQLSRNRNAMILNGPARVRKVLAEFDSTTRDSFRSYRTLKGHFIP